MDYFDFLFSPYCQIPFYYLLKLLKLIIAPKMVKFGASISFSQLSDIFSLLIQKIIKTKWVNREVAESVDSNKKNEISF